MAARGGPGRGPGRWGRGGDAPAPSRGRHPDPALPLGGPSGAATWEARVPCRPRAGSRSAALRPWSPGRAGGGVSRVGGGRRPRAPESGRGRRREGQPREAAGCRASPAFPDPAPE